MAEQQGTFSILFPGKFDSYFSGTEIGQGINVERYRLAGDRLLAERYAAATIINRTKGYSKKLTGLTLDALFSVVEYADYCIDANKYGEPDPAKKAAAKKVKGDALRMIRRHGR